MSFRFASLHLLNLHLQEQLHWARPSAYLAQYSAAAGGQWQMLKDECKNGMGTWRCFSSLQQQALLKLPEQELLSTLNVPDGYFLLLICLINF